MTRREIETRPDAANDLQQCCAQPNTTANGRPAHHRRATTSHHLQQKDTMSDLAPNVQRRLSETPSVAQPWPLLDKMQLRQSWMDHHQHQDLHVSTDNQQSGEDNSEEDPPAPPCWDRKHELRRRLELRLDPALPNDIARDIHATEATTPELSNNNDTRHHSGLDIHREPTSSLAPRWPVPRKQCAAFSEMDQTTAANFAKEYTISPFETHRLPVIAGSSNTNRLSARVATMTPSCAVDQVRPAQHFVFMPASRFLVLWNVLHLLSLAYVCTGLPYIVAVSPVARDADTSWADAINRAVDFFYILDIAVNFRSAYLDQESGDIVTQPRAIAMNYAKTWLAFDCLMAFPFDMVLDSHVHNINWMFILRILRLSRLAKLLRVAQTESICDYCEDALGVSRNKLVVAQLACCICLLAHFTACGFILTGVYSQEVLPDVPLEQRSWIDRNGLMESTPQQIYIAALYWAFTMMTTVGFGDIVPVTASERLFSIIAMVISAGTYAYVIAKISTMVTLINISESRYYEKINELNAYMKYRQLPRGLQLQTRRFFRYYLAKKTVFDENAFFDVLPSNLREAMVDHYVASAMHHISLLHGVEKGFVAHITFLLKPVFFPPGNLVIRVNDIGNELFLVSNGTLVVVADVPVSRAAVPVDQIDSEFAAKPTRRQLFIAELNDGDHFGEMALLCDDPRHRRTANVVAQTYCELHSLAYEHVTTGLAKYPLVSQKLNQSANERLSILQDMLRLATTRATPPPIPSRRGSSPGRVAQAIFSATNALSNELRKLTHTEYNAFREPRPSIQSDDDASNLLISPSPRYQRAETP